MMNILDFGKKKAKGEKIVMVTCYDATSAAIIDGTDVDCLLVGDSGAMTMHGFSTTVNATMDMMVLHTAAVARGARNKFIIGDLPFASYRRSLSETVDAAYRLMQAGAHAVKLEGADGNLDAVRHLVQSGIPIMGHIGLTPQSVHQLGGFRVQGKTDDAAERLKKEASQLQDAGCFSIVLECVPASLAAEITGNLAIATIGIGAGAGTDGQVLVFQDLLGLNTAFKPKFVKHYMQGAELIGKAVGDYAREVRAGAFPDDDHHF